MKGNRIINIIKEASRPVSSDYADILFGEVTSLEPLKIWVDNRLEIKGEQIILSMLVKEMIIKIPTPDSFTHTHTISAHSTESGGDVPHTHTIAEKVTQSALPEIKLWRGLETGDKVILIRAHLGQKYYVAERVIE